MHVRTQVRRAFETALESVSGGGALGVNRARAWPKGTTVGLGVRVPQEVSRDTDMDGGQERVITVAVDAVIKGQAREANSDLSDAIGAEIERAVFGAGDLGGIAQAVSYRGTMLGFDEGADKPAARVSVAFEVTVYTVETDPETAL